MKAKSHVFTDGSFTKEDIVGVMGEPDAGEQELRTDGPFPACPVGEQTGGWQGT